MKLIQATLAIAAILPAAAQAGDVVTLTPYGIFDAGIASQSKTAAGGSNTGFVAGAVLPVILGVNGSHDLPNGSKVTFKLEAGTNLETGDSGFAKNAHWGRGATVGLAGAWGSVTAGMETTPYILDLGSVDPLGLSQGGSALIPYLDALGVVGIFDDRMFQYRSPALGSFKFSAGLGTGNVPGSSSQGREIQATATYTDGAFNAGSGVLNIHGDSVGNGRVKGFWLGGGYKFGEFSLKGFMQDTKRTTSGAERHTSQLGAGASYQITPSLSATYGLYRYKDQANAANKAIMNAFLGKYALDSATTLYLGATSVNNKGAMQVAPMAGSSFGGNTPPPNATTRALFTGMYFIF